VGSSFAEASAGQANAHKLADLLSFVLKNPLSRKSWAFEFLNLTLCAREARGTPKNHWLSLTRTKESQSEKNLVSSLVPLYYQIRTYFQNR